MFCKIFCFYMQHIPNQGSYFVYLQHQYCIVNYAMLILHWTKWFKKMFIFLLCFFYDYEKLNLVYKVLYSILLKAMLHFSTHNKQFSHVWNILHSVTVVFCVSFRVFFLVLFLSYLWVWKIQMLSNCFQQCNYH